MKVKNSARAFVACAAIAMLSSGALFAQTKYPYLDAVYPPVVSRGAATTVEVSASGSLKTAYLALVSGEGIRAEVLPRSEEKKLPDGSAAVRIEVAPGAAVGPRDLRLATEEALTTVATIYVSDLPAVLEGPKHADPAEAQEIAIPCVVNGRIGGSVEVDWYRFTAKKGERVNFNLLGARLHETIQHVGRFTPHFDGFLAVTGASGRELASNDDHYFADPLLSFEAPADGSYQVAVREANYKGHASYTYGLAATRGPCAANTLPLALPPGSRAAVELVGPGFGPSDLAEVELPAGAVPGRGYAVRPLLAGGGNVEEVEVAASFLPTVREAEAPGEAGNDPLSGAQQVPIPAGIAGRIGRPDDVDCFSFSAVKGSAYRFELIARRLFSPLDGEVVVLDEKGSVLASADDSRDLAGRTVKDSLLLWTAPADGRYLVRIRDLHQRGGPEFVYHLECAMAEPDFELTLDPCLTMIGPGNRSVVYVRALRKGGFDGPISIGFEGLPAGVEALTAPILPGMTDACVVLSARPDAKRGAAIYRVLGKASVKLAGGEVEITREAEPLVEIYQAQRVVGRTPAAAVTSPSDIEVTTEVRELVLKPGESKEIPVRLVRGEKYKSGPVTLWAMWRFEGSIFGNSLPPGVTVNEKASSTSLNGEAVEGKISLQAAPDAKPITRVQTAVIGLVPIEYSVFVPYSTPPIYVTVAGKDGAVAAAK